MTESRERAMNCGETAPHDLVIAAPKMSEGNERCREQLSLSRRGVVGVDPMTFLDELANLKAEERHTFVASLLAWTLDAFDFFVLVFTLSAIAKDFGTDVKAVTVAILLTLAARPVGALLFGWFADRYGRRPVLMFNVACFSVLEVASALAPSLAVFLVLRAVYGIAMGGIWGVAASITFERVPTSARGIVSGILQQGYAAGYLLAAVAFAFLFPVIGWRGMFLLGAAPVLLIPYIWFFVPESPSWRPSAGRIGNPFAAIRDNWRAFAFMVVLMTAFNFFSHGTQDLYPTFLQVEHKLPTETVGIIAIIYNVGAIMGGTFFGAFSERIGRRRAIVLASLLAIPIVPLWAFAGGPILLAVGAFLIQVMVQGAWGVVPIHLNELSPEGTRGTLPGLAYQLGNLLAASNATVQATIAQATGGNYGLALAIVAVAAAILIAVIAWFGREAKDVAFGSTE
jgi:SHS family lactate transporter-like MFS transporter